MVFTIHLDEYKQKGYLSFPTFRKMEGRHTKYDVLVLILDPQLYWRSQVCKSNQPPSLPSGVNKFHVFKSILKTAHSSFIFVQNTLLRYQKMTPI
jgi:hypothetical protein